jgi:hypothetical protein
MDEGGRRRNKKIKKEMKVEGRRKKQIKDDVGRRE